MSTRCLRQSELSWAGSSLPISAGFNPSAWALAMWWRAAAMSMVSCGRRIFIGIFAPGRRKG